MIRFDFSEKFHGLLCAGMICFPFATFAAEQGQPNVTAVKPPQVVLTNVPLTGTLPPATPQPPQPVASPAALTNLVFDVETKEYEAKLGEATALFTFHLKNVSDVPVHVLRVNASCGCTAAKLPPMPWVIQPGTNEELNATMQLAGKPPGKTTKTLTISSTNGTKTIFVTAIIPAPPATMTEAARQKNLELAKSDRQTVFKNDCASCHAEKGKGLLGAALYKADCGICHDSEHRADGVQDIASLNRPPDTNYWRTTIAKGIEKPGSLMPAFAQENGGPLTKEQIDSLVTYMTTDFPRDHKPTPQIKLPAAIPAPGNQPPHASVSPGPPLPPGIPGQPQAVVLPTVQPIKK